MSSGVDTALEVGWVRLLGKNVQFTALLAKHLAKEGLPSLLCQTKDLATSGHVTRFVL